MAERFTALEQEHIDFIEHQQLFFVATAGAEGHINLSPKGMDTLRVSSPQCVSWLNLTGSGNETAAHVLHDGRMTLMFCSFERQPLILRLYGRARAVHPRDPDWPQLLGQFGKLPGARQVFELDIELVQTSCGYGVPLYSFERERPTLRNWTDKRGPDAVRDYWQEKNRLSLDGMDTGIV